jgi:Contact-dependent growth inhibition CdiA C-terminal domain
MFISKHLTPVGRRGADTADFLVGGFKGTGKGGVPTDVFTPITEKPANVLLGIANKKDQAENIIVNLRHTNVQSNQLGNVKQSLFDLGAGNIKSVKIIE